MKPINAIITEMLNAPATGDANAPIQKAVNQLLGEDIEFSSGETVAIVDDPSWPYNGVKAKCKGPSAKGSGFVDVEMPDGTCLPMQSSLLLRVK